MVRIAIPDANLSSNVVSASMFSTNYLTRFYSSSLDGNFSAALKISGATGLRYPGGSMTEESFSVTDPNRTEDDIGNKITPLNAFLDLAKGIGAEVTIVIPTRQIFGQIHDEYGNRYIDPSRVAEVRDFIKSTLQNIKDDGEVEPTDIIKAFELGNEYWGSGEMTSTEYGRVVNALAPVIVESIASILGVEAAKDIGILSQMGGPWGAEFSFSGVYGSLTFDSDQGLLDELGIEPSDFGINGLLTWEAKLRISNENIINELSPLAAASITGLVEHFYLNSGADDLVKNSDTLRYIDYDVQLWGRSGFSDKDLVITEWNIQSNNVGQFGLKGAGAIIFQFSTMIEMGVDEAFTWPLLGNLPTDLAGGLSGTPRLSPAGAALKHLSDNTIGLNLLEVDANYADLEISSFGSSSKVVIYISGRTAKTLNLELDVSKIVSDLDLASAQILGFDPLTSDGYQFQLDKGIVQVPGYVEHDVKALIEDLDERTIYHDGLLSLSLGAYEVAMLVFDRQVVEQEYFLAECSVGAFDMNFIISAKTDEGLVKVHILNSSGTPILASSLYLGSPPGGIDIRALTSVQISGQTIVLALSGGWDQLFSFVLSASGVLQPGDQRGAMHGLELNNPSSMTTFEVWGETYVVVASSGSSSLTLFAVTASGELNLRDQVIDGLDTRFASVQAVTAVTVGDRAFVIAGGGDDGLNLFSVLPGGRLVLVAQGLGGPGLTLPNITSISAVGKDEKIEVSVIAQGDSVNRFSLDPGPLAPAQFGSSGADTLIGGAAGDMLSGNAGNDLVQAGDGADIIIDGTGIDLLFGGAGADVFVLVADGVDDHVRDFQVGIDKIDISAWGRIYDLSALNWEVASIGAIVTYGSERVLITTANSQPLLQSTMKIQDFVWLDHDMPVAIPFDPQVLLGTAGNDVQTGSGGNDRFTGTTGADTIDGQAGTDVVDYSASATGLVIDMVTPASSTGLAAGDVFTSVEAVVGGAGHDTIRGGVNAGQLDGGAGNDHIFGLVGPDHLIGGLGDDRLFGGAGGDSLDGGAGRDTVSYALAPAAVAASLRTQSGTAGDASGDIFVAVEDIEGSVFSDTLTGNAWGNTLYGGAGNDVLSGREGDDTFFGGAGADFFDGGDGIDMADYSQSTSGIVIDMIHSALNTGDAAGDRFVFVEGVQSGAGNDMLYGTAGADRLLGGAGNDTIFGRGGLDTLDGGLGWDLLVFGDQKTGVSLTLGESRDAGTLSRSPTFLNFDEVHGTAFDDTLLGGAADEQLFGGNGRDRLSGGTGDDLLAGGKRPDWLFADSGNDTIDGGKGLDRADYKGATGAVVIDLQFPNNNAGFALGDLLMNVEKLTSGAFDDTLSGDQNRNVLTAGNGNDSLSGRDGNDRLFGGRGNDTLDGGGGDDVLVGSSGHDVFLFTGGHDTIIRFRKSVDRIGLDETLFDAASLAEAIRAAASSGDDLIIQFSSEATVCLKGFGDAALTEDVFHFF